MKKVFRSGLVVVLLLAGMAALFWYLLMRREVPKHARCIPKNAIAVLTLNLRELALDHSSGGHLFPETAGKKIFRKETEAFTKALETNEGSGLSSTADVLGFFFRDGEEAYWGICASIKDSAKFGKLLREQLTKQFSIKSFSLQGTTMARFDTTSAVLGWNKGLAVLLYPFGNSGIAQTSSCCAKLLSQKEAQSVLADENFRQHELSSFDAGLWIQPGELLKFTQGGSLMKAYFSNEKYISLLIDFTDGEVITRKLVTYKNKVTQENFPLMLNCDPAEVKGFYHTVMNLGNDSAAENYLETPPFDHIPFDRERNRHLARMLNGNFTLLVHDTFSYEKDYITYTYDENSEPAEKHEKKKETSRAFTASYGIKDTAAARKLLNSWIAEDSIPAKGKKWVIRDDNQPVYMILSGSTLTFSDWEKTDGEMRGVPEAWDGLDAFLPVGKIFVKDYEGVFSLLSVPMDKGVKLLSENIGDLLISSSLLKGNESSCQVRLTMHNKKVNALVQLEELFRKIADDGK